jgi:FKBP-type peptidyl-prolyl cis-trans isomerase
MNITITIDAPELVAAINNLAAAMSGNGLVAALTAPAKEADTTEADAAAAAKAAKDAKAAKAAADAAAKAAKAAAAKKKPEPTVTIEEVRAIANQLVQSGKRAELKTILTDLGVAKLSEVGEDDYQSFLDSAKGLLGDDDDLTQ